MTSVIPVINVSNISFILNNSSSYTDFKIFILIFGIAIACLILSIIFKEMLQRISLSIISILLSTISAFLSLNVAFLDYSITVLSYNLSDNLSAAYASNLIVIPMSNFLITFACIISIIIGILILLDAVLISLMPKPTAVKSFNSEWWYRK
jgi:hypothetical protein